MQSDAAHAYGSDALDDDALDEALSEVHPHRVHRPEPRFSPLLAGMLSATVLGAVAAWVLLGGPTQSIGAASPRFFDLIAQAMPVTVLLTCLVGWPLHHRLERRGIPLGIQIMLAPFAGSLAGLVCGLLLGLLGGPFPASVDLTWALIWSFAGAWCGVLGRLLAEAFARSPVATVAGVGIASWMWLAGSLLVLARVG